MKKLWILLLALALLLAICACGDKAETEEVTGAETTETQSAEPTTTPPSAELGSGRFDAFEAAFTGAERFTTADGSEAMRVYFDFANRSDEAVSAQERLLISAVQDGKTLLWAESDEPRGEEENLTLRVQSGHSIRCAVNYALVSDSPLAILLDDGDGHTVSALLPLDQLPGAPEDAAEEPSTEETLTTSLDPSCELSGLYTIELTGGETADTDEGRVMTVTLDFTNNADPQEADIWASFRLFAYQDGVELSYADAEEATIETAAFGQTVSTAATFLLRSESPVLVELYGFRETTPSAGIVLPVE